MRKIIRKNNEDNEHEKKRGYQIVGIVEDFQYQSLHKKVDPLLIQLGDEHQKFLILNMRGENISNTVEKVKGIWETSYPDFPFDCLLWQGIDLKAIKSRRIAKFED